MRVSVARRLAILAATEVITFIVLVIVALGSLLDVEANVIFVKHYLLPPIDVLGAALVENARMQDLVADRTPAEERTKGDLLREHVRSLTRIEARYRAEWLTEPSRSPEAARVRAALRTSGHLALLERERVTLERFSDAVDRLDVLVKGDPAVGERAVALAATLADIQSALRGLRNMNTEVLGIAETLLEEEVRSLRRGLLVVGATGTIVAAWAALRVRSAIAPRIQRLVASVERFRELGVHQRLLETGEDEIAILANAIDAGFLAIVERDHERERFLAVAAHELKTPLASILGFAQVANMQPGRQELGRRALTVIERQAARLSRLVDDVFLAARARAGDLPVHPQSIDLVEHLRKMLTEVGAYATEPKLELEAPSSARVLADAELLPHALWSLLTYAVAASVPSEPVRITVTSAPPRAEIRVDLRLRSVVLADLERALSPFASAVYEGGAGARTGVGLYLCREIVRLHGGSLHVEATPTGGIIRIELPS